MSEEEKVFEAYKLTIVARNFHYDNFNKWMTFYYIAVAAIFMIFFSGKIEDIQSKLCFAFSGLIVSILWHLSCKGYYFWIKNWIFLVKRFEDKMADNYKVYLVFSKQVKEKHNSIFIPTQSLNISTSKVTLILSLLVCLVWSYLLMDNLSDYVTCFKLGSFATLISAILIMYVLLFIAGKFLKTDLKNHKLI